ncbi:Pimeloyl-ACP methyl ester carboxylesterase [Saccharicrinis carchari]|uniref:Pimeloyl-ACP methyl ester carboxylesterase n=1 Tax=Saccharicrinis carchari TaxID=1168039 RepID=A0A521F6L7_SACCC|nr:alpha/beta hydrolase [Saccharicrinis carchari]SMO91855.1 Pimeloyl-ACP methyl ester carboxylesterase [Saccharicrinis carchari]
MFILLFPCLRNFSQTLERRAFLGVVMKEIPDSIKAKNPIINGVYVNYIFPNSTANHTKLCKGAILNKINDVPIRTKADAIKTMNNIREGDFLIINYTFNGLEKAETIIAVGKPFEISESADVYYDFVDFQGCKLRTILHKPKGKVNCPVVFFIQGYSCLSVEQPFYKNSPYLKFYEDLVNSGYAVYRLEKAGVGDSESSFDCMQMGFHSECSTFKQAYQSLIKNPKIDSTNIFLFGHSVGGIIAPILAEEYSPRGIIAYGTVVKSWFEYLIDVKWEQGYIWKKSAVQISKNLRGFIPFWYDLLIQKENSQEILKNMKHKSFLTEHGLLEDFKNERYLNRSLVYWQELNEINVCEKWAYITTHVLCLHGEFDIQALNTEWAHMIRDIVSTNSPNKADIYIVSNTDHDFVYFENMDKNTKILDSNEYHNYSMKNYSTVVAENAINWMDATRKN